VHADGHILFGGLHRYIINCVTLKFVSTSAWQMSHETSSALFRYWIRHFPMSFDHNPELSQSIHRLQETILQDEDEDSELAGMVDISKV
jgi:hypothetical protein